MKYEKRLDLSNNRHQNLYWKNNGEYLEKPNYDSLIKKYYHSAVIEIQHKEQRILTKAERKKIYNIVKKSY